jgi:hypothetical protein
MPNRCPRGILWQAHDETHERAKRCPATMSNSWELITEYFLRLPPPSAITSLEELF